MRDEAVEPIGHRRAGGAAGLVARAEHEVVDEQLGAAVEQLVQRLLPLVGVEAVLLLHLHPRQLAPHARQLVAATGVLLLELQQLLARRLPLLRRRRAVLRHRDTRPCARTEAPPAAAWECGRAGTGNTARRRNPVPSP